jgi:ABC-type phosphate transport system substrate-binding protein
MIHQKRVLLAVPALAVLALTACGSSAPSSSAASGKATQTAETTATCEQVSAVLSDGPDPGADPVGYAEAQVDPLRRISTSDAALQGAIDKLADAYQTFYTSNGTKTAGEAVSVASSAINSICPGAAS